MEKEQLKEKLKSDLNRFEKNKSTYDEKATFEQLYDFLETMRVIQRKDDEAADYLKKRIGHYTYSQVSRFDNIRYAFQEACKHSFPRMDTNPLTELKKFSPFVNNANGGKMGIKNENDFNTISNVLVIIRNNLKHGIKRNTDQDKQIVNLANKILQTIVSTYVRSIKTAESFKISDLIPFIGLLLLGALMFFYLFGSFITGDNSTSIPENCSWQYTQDNVVCE